LDEPTRESLPTHREILQGPLGLGAIESPRWHLHLTQGVLFISEFAGHDLDQLLVLPGWLTRPELYPTREGIPRVAEQVQDGAGHVLGGEGPPFL